MTKSYSGKGGPNAGNSAHNRTKYQKLLRKTIRRRPCSYILLTNVIILCILTALIGITAYFITKSQAKLTQYAREENILKSKKNQVTFQYCAYEDKPSPFFTDHCQDSCGTTAFAWRERTLKKSNSDPTCLDWREQIDCHSSSYCIDPTRRRDHIPECGGVYDQPISTDTTPEKTVIAPAITNEVLKEYMNRTFLANQFVIYCPKCQTQTNDFSFKGENNVCYRKLLTTATGWPSQYHFCDLFEKQVGKTNCSEISIENPLKPEDNS